MGSYHGKKGFETFSHYKSIVDKKTWMDLPIRYSPTADFPEAASSVSEIIKTPVQYEYKTHTAPVISSWTNKCQNLSEKVPPFLLSCNNGYFDFLLIFAKVECTAHLYQNVVSYSTSSDKVSGIAPSSVWICHRSAGIS